METNLKEYIVYMTINLVNNKIYIGVHKTENPNIFDGYIGCNVKINSPSTYMNPSTPFQYAVKKYGVKNFKRYTIKSNLTRQEALELEAILVDKEFISREDTYNVALGGNIGKVCKKIFQFDFKGNLLKEWDNIYIVSESINSTYNSLLAAITYKLSRKGYYWSFENKIDITKYCNNKGINVFQYDSKSLKLIDSFSSYEEASKILNIKKDSIQRSVKCGYRIKDWYFSDIKSDTYSNVKSISVAKKPIYIYDLNGNFVKELKVKKDILEFFKVKTLSGIRDSIRSGIPYKEYQISLEKLEKLKPIKSKRNISKKVGKYDLNEKLLETYNTVTAARKIYGVGVSRCLKGIQNTCKGYIFKYIS